MPDASRLTTEQLAALTPGDTVTIESGFEFTRRRYSTGTIARITNQHAVIQCGPYVECYSLATGTRDGGLGHARLVHQQQLAERRAQTASARIDQAYRQWTRNRRDLHRLQQLHAAIGEVLEESSARA